jgi:hypothetical protein
MAGCDVKIEMNNSRRLMDRPDFVDVVKASPSWAKEALKTINRLEEIIEGGLSAAESSGRIKTNRQLNTISVDIY